MTSNDHFQKKEKRNETSEPLTKKTTMIQRKILPNVKEL